MTRNASFVSGAMTENERRHQEALKRGSRKALQTARKRAKGRVTVTPSQPGSHLMTVTAPSTPIVTGNQQDQKVRARLRRYALVFDMSGSMTDGFRSNGPGAIKMANALKQRLVMEDADGCTVVTTVLFGTRVEVGQKNYKPKGLKDIYQWPNMGMTALYDAVLEGSRAIEDGAGPDDTFCVIVVTDGEENQSRTNATDFVRQVQQRQGTNRWTYVFNLPPNKLESFVHRTGLPRGNMQEWSDIEQVERTVADGISAYTRATQAGENSVTNFLLNVKIDEAVLKTLPDIRSNLKVWAVNKLSRLDEFVLSHGVTFEIGKAFYQLTKNEKVEAGKEILIVKKTFTTNGSKTLDAVYSNGRKALGLPAGEVRKLIPQDLGNYEVYVLSTSNNRLLLPGTRLLYLI